MTLVTGRFQGFNKKPVTMRQPYFSCNKLKEKESGAEQMEMETEKLEKRKSERVREEISPKSNLTF